MDNPALVSSMAMSTPAQPNNNRGILFRKVQGFESPTVPLTQPHHHLLHPQHHHQQNLSTVEETSGVARLLDSDSTQDSFSEYTYSPRTSSSSDHLNTNKNQDQTLPPAKKGKGKGIFNFSNFTRHVSMTPYAHAAHNLHTNAGPREDEAADYNQQRRRSTGSSKSSKSSLIHTDLKEMYQAELKTWNVTMKANKNYKHDDPLIYATERLTTFIETYELILEKQRRNSSSSDSSHYSKEGRQNSLPLVREMQKAPLKVSEKIDLIGFWTISALKTISNVDALFTGSVVTEFSNFDLKEKEKIRVFNTQGEFFGLQWAWQLALDNPNTRVYDFTLKPIIPTSFSSNKPTIGPTNFHSIHGESLTELSFSRNSFAFAICYDLWLQLKSHEWVPALSEVHRVLLPSGTIHLMLHDFDIINCTNSLYQSFFDKIQRILRKNNMDTHPCKHIQQRLKDSGFERIKYSFISLQKGIPSKVGNLMEFIQIYFEYVIFDKIANIEMDPEDLEMFRELKAQYHHDTMKGKLLAEFGSSYCMFVFAKKGAA